MLEGEGVVAEHFATPAMHGRHVGGVAGGDFFEIAAAGDQPLSEVVAFAF